MKRLIMFFTIVGLAGCGNPIDRIEKAIANSIPDGEVLILASPEVNALLILSDQTMEPEDMNFALYIADDAGNFDFNAPSVSKSNQTMVSASPFRVGWSGATRGKGYLYPTSSPDGHAMPEHLAIYRTRTNDLRAVALNLKTTKYEKVK